MIDTSPSQETDLLPGEEGPLGLYAYISSFTGNPKQINLVLQQIQAVAQKNNQRHHITGVLFYHNSQFLQIIEGPPPAIHTLKATLRQDSRHQNMHGIIDQDVIQRGFGQWNMDSFNLSDQESLNIAELHAIRDAFLSTFHLHAKRLTDFYKIILATHDL